MLKYIAIFAIYSLCCIFDASFQGPVNQECLACICEAISGCTVTETCVGEYCGAFQIGWPYWFDSGKPTFNGESAESPSAYTNCALDINCSALAVQGYMNKFQQDCNKDGKIDCDDYAAIHKLGGYGCQAELQKSYHDRYFECKKIVGSGQLPSS